MSDYIILDCRSMRPKVVHGTYAHLFPSHSLLIRLLLLRFAETIPCRIPQQLPILDHKLELHKQLRLLVL